MRTFMPIGMDAFLDGLSDVFKHEILKVSSCQTVTQAIPICSNYEFCMKSGNKQRENVFVLSKAFWGQKKTSIDHLLERILVVVLVFIKNFPNQIKSGKSRLLKHQCLRQDL
jgi:hypothetical protein